MSVKKRALYCALGLLWVACVYCWLRYMYDQRWMERKAREIVAVSGSRDQRSQVIAVRDYVRRRVQHAGAPHDGRPFLRATARETLESGKGYCGESSRACINLLGELGILARRINLYGQINHVIVEVRLAQGADILIDPQENDLTNAYFDSQDRELDSIVGSSRSLFSDYSTIHLRRMPILGGIVQRVRLRYSPITWIMEDPWLIKALLAGGALITLLILAVLDRLLIELYARRLGVRLVRGRTGPDLAISLPRINVMKIAGTTRLLFVVIATAWFAGRTTIRAQSRDEADEQKFAARLSRRAHRSAARPAISTGTRPAVPKVETLKPARDAIDNTRSSAPPISEAVRVKRSPTGPTLGLAAATPVMPSKNGPGRDAFVESLYPQVLGTAPTQSELNFLTRALKRGQSTESIARTLWNSPAHRKLVREHKAPNISFAKAYRKALAAARAAQKPS